MSEQAPQKPAKPFATTGQIICLLLFLAVVAATVGPNIMPFLGRNFLHEGKVQFVSIEVEQKEGSAFLVVRGVLRSPAREGIGEIFICQNTLEGNCDDISDKDIYPFINGDIRRLADDEVIILIEQSTAQSGASEDATEFLVEVPLEGNVTKVFFGAGMSIDPSELWNKEDGSWAASHLEPVSQGVAE